MRDVIAAPLNSAIRAQSAERLHEELLPRFSARVVALHETHARRVDGVFVIAVVERRLVANRLHLERRGDEQRSAESNLRDHEDTRESVDKAAAVAAAALFHHFSRVLP